MKKIYRNLIEFIRFIILTKRSNFTFKEKFEVLRIQFANHFKSIGKQHKAEVTQKIFGFEVTAYSYSSLKCLFKEIFLLNDYLCELDGDTPKIIDCGANIGMAIFYFKKRYPNCHIKAYEPNPNAFRLLEKNVTQNNLKNVQLFNIGLSDQNGTVDFFLSNDKGTLLGSLLQERGGENKISVQAKTLSSLIKDDQIDLIKIDIEGAEIQVIDDLVQAKKIKNCKNYIIEYHHKINGAKSKLSSFLEHFESNDFDYNIRANYLKLGGFQDVLLYFYKSE